MPTLDELRLLLSEEASDAEEARLEEERREAEEQRELEFQAEQARLKEEQNRLLALQTVEQSIPIFSRQPTHAMPDGTVWAICDLPLWHSIPEFPSGVEQPIGTKPQPGMVVNLPLDNHVVLPCSIHSVQTNANIRYYECTWDWRSQRQGVLIVEDAGRVRYWRQVKPVPFPPTTVQKDGETWHICDLTVQRKSNGVVTWITAEPAVGDVVQLPVNPQVSLPVEITMMATSNKTVDGKHTYICSWDWAGEKSGELVVFDGKVFLWRQYNVRSEVAWGLTATQAMQKREKNLISVEDWARIVNGGGQALITDHGFQAGKLGDNICVFWHPAPYGGSSSSAYQCGGAAELHAKVRQPNTRAEVALAEYKCQHTYIITNGGHIICGKCGERNPHDNNG